MPKARRDKGPIHPTFGDKVRWWREERRLSVNELARRAGVSASLVSAYERLQTNPRYVTACKLAATLHVHVSWLWDHTPPPDRLPPGF